MPDEQDREESGKIEQRKPTICFQVALILLVWTPLVVWLYGYEELLQKDDPMNA